MEYEIVKDDISDSIAELSVHKAVVALKALNNDKYKGVTGSEIQPHLNVRKAEVLVKKADAAKLEAEAVAEVL